MLKASKTKRRVVTYMAGFEGVKFLKRERVTPEHQPDAKWPLFLYEIGGGEDNHEEETGHQDQAEYQASTQEDKSDQVPFASLETTTQVNVAKYTVLAAAASVLIAVVRNRFFR
jgi:hypothetical protein